MRVWKTNIYNLETGKYSSTPPFSKKTFGGSNFGGYFWLENLEFIKFGF